KVTGHVDVAGRVHRHAAAVVIVAATEALRQDQASTAAAQPPQEDVKVAGRGQVECSRTGIEVTGTGKAAGHHHVVLRVESDPPSPVPVRPARQRVRPAAVARGTDVGHQRVRAGAGYKSGAAGEVEHAGAWIEVGRAPEVAGGVDVAGAIHRHRVGIIQVGAGNNVAGPNKGARTGQFREE